MSERPSRLVRLTTKDRDAGVAVLGRAFAKYELFRYYFRDEKEQRAAADMFSFMSVYVSLKCGEAYATSEKFEGVATWLPPGQLDYGGPHVMRSVPPSVLHTLGPRGVGLLEACARRIDGLHRRLVPYPHWYLDMIGVDPSCQGRGFCSRLVRPVLERMDREGTPCYLETSAEKNVAIYRRFGFEVMLEDKMPGTELMIFAMLRKAQTA
jgi:ribosomal protein S18 acetylase RimI-like enzyme